MMRRRGFTLIELVIAAGIVGIALIGIASLFLFGLEAAKTNTDYTQAAILGHNAIEFLKHYDYGDGGFSAGPHPASGTYSDSNKIDAPANWFPDIGDSRFNWSYAVEEIGNTKKITVTVSWERKSITKEQTFITTIVKDTP